MNEYKNTFKDEVNLAEILLYCLRKWRCVVVTMLAMAALLGGCKYYSAQKGNQLALQQWNEIDPEEKKEVKDSDALQYYESAIEESAETLQMQKDYMENSMVMQLDANHIQKGTLSYALKVEDLDQRIGLQNMLVAAYQTYATDGRLAKLLYSEDEHAAISDWQLLVTFLEPSIDSIIDGNKESIDSGQLELEHGVFQIQIISQDADSCEKYLETVIQNIQSYSEELKKQIADHELVLLGSSMSESQDQTIREYQLKILNDYQTGVRNMNVLRTEAKTCAQNAETSGTASDSLTGPVLANPVRIGIKYGILGLVLGAVMAGFVLIVIYLMSDRLRSTENFERKFGMRLLGRVIGPVRGKKLFDFLDRWIQQLGVGAYANLPYEEQLKIVSANVKAAISSKIENPRIMIAGTIASKDAKEICNAVGRERDGVKFSDYRQLIFDASAVEALSDYDGILFIEKKDVSSARLICQEYKMAADRGMTILGAIVM